MLEAKAIQNNHLVYGLSDEELGRIAEMATERVYQKDEFLCRQGEVGGELFIVLEGRLRVQVGQHEELDEIGPGAVVGEMGLIEPRSRAASVVALEKTRVAAISKADLREELITDGNLGFIVLCNITRVLTDRLRQADEKLGMLMSTAVSA